MCVRLSSVPAKIAALCSFKQGQVLHQVSLNRMRGYIVIIRLQSVVLYIFLAVGATWDF